MRTPRRLFAVLFVLSAAALWTSALRAQLYQTRNVPSQYPTIQSAINAANEGDTILVAPGIYYENIDFLGKPLLVTSSAGAATTIIDGSHGTGAATVTFSNTPFVGDPNSPSIASIFSGFTVQGGGTEPASKPTGGILIQGNGPYIQNNIITHNHCAGISIGIVDASIENNEIDNTLDNNGDCPGAGSGAAIVYSCGTCGETDGSTPSAIAGNTIQNNVQIGAESSTLPVGGECSRLLRDRRQHHSQQRQLQRCRWIGDLWRRDCHPKPHLR